jgi:hypothetical protein
MHLLIAALFLIFSRHVAEAEEIQTLTFSQLWALDATEPVLQDRQVRIRGFLYSTLEGRLILAEEPDLKSCCTNRLKKKVEVSGAIKQENISAHAHLIEGLLRMEALPDGENGRRFRLENAQIVVNNGSGLLFSLSAGGILLVSASGIFFYTRRARR